MVPPIIIPVIERNF